MITLEKLYLSRPKNCLTKLSSICENNHLNFKLPILSQLHNYLYRYRESLIAQNYPEVRQYLTEIVQKTYNNSLKEDETFFIYSQFEKGEISVLFSSKALIENIIKQCQYQPSFIHLDATYKLIDLGLPLFIVSTEDINHSFRPIAFFVSWSESISQVTILLQKLCQFLLDHFNFQFKPKYILTDNSDALISGCQKAFTHEYIHLGCQFHLAKRIKEKSNSQELKDKKSDLFFGVKALKNSPTLPFFKKVWEIIKKYWQEKNVSKTFIDTFENEYIKKSVQWHYGAAFPGKSRTNNSLESGNNVLKIFFQRKSQNIKVFFCKMKDFIREWSIQEKTKFPYMVAHLSSIKKAAEKSAQEDPFIYHNLTPNVLYYPRKGIPKDELEEALKSLFKRGIIPQSFKELHEGWCYYRTINPIQNQCDCAEFYKYNYCKHILAIQILDGQLADPEIKEKKKRGRKSNITKALQK